MPAPAGRAVQLVRRCVCAGAHATPSFAMGMPNDLVLIRHGQSEGNVATEAAKTGDTQFYTDAFMTTPGHRWRLTDLGRAQAACVGRWLNASGVQFDRCYVSPYVRTRETAAHLALGDVRWLLNRALRERDWGDIGSLPRDEFRSRPEFALNAAMRDLDPLYWRPPGGESIAQVAEDRVRNVCETLHRECDGDKVVAVTHGEVMWAFRLVLERLDDETFEARDADPAHKIHNCEVLHYSRRDPVSSVRLSRLGWVRRARPVGSVGSLEMKVGEWEPVEFNRYTSDELLAQVSQTASLFDAETSG